MVKRGRGVERPVHALHRLLDLQPVKDPRHQPGIAGLRAEPGNIVVDFIERAADFLAQLPARREMQRSRNQAPARRRGRRTRIRVQPHQQEVFLHAARRLEQVRPAAVFGQADIRVVSGEIVGQQRAHFRLRSLGPRLSAKHQLALAGRQPVLLRPVGGKITIGLEPLRQIERLQPDLEQRLQPVLAEADHQPASAPAGASATAAATFMASPPRSTSRIWPIIPPWLSGVLSRALASVTTAGSSRS